MFIIIALLVPVPQNLISPFPILISLSSFVKAALLDPQWNSAMDLEH